MILNIKPSPLKTKRFRATIREGNTEKTIDFGFKSALRFGLTFIDGASEAVKAAYQSRHLGNLVEAKLIRDLTLSPALLSFYILWGSTRSVESNRIALNKMLKEKG